jgi:hypothetical protein
VDTGESEEAEDPPSLRLQLFVDPLTVAYLKELAETGAYGSRKHTKVAKALIEEGLRRASRAGLITMRKGGPR